MDFTDALKGIKEKMEKENKEDLKKKEEEKIKEKERKLQEEFLEFFK